MFKKISHKYTYSMFPPRNQSDDGKSLQTQQMLQAAGRLVLLHDTVVERSSGLTSSGNVLQLHQFAFGFCFSMSLDLIM